jgi:hypothetical protein
MTRPAPWKRSTRRERFARRQEFKAMDAARLAANRPVNARMAARRRAVLKLRRAEAGDPNVRPLTPIELRALGRPEDEIAEAEARIVEEAEARENQRRAAEFAKIDREWTPSPRSTVPKPDVAADQLDDIQRVADRHARRPLKPTPAPKPAPEAPPPIRYFLSVEQYRALDAGLRLRRLLSAAVQ